MLIREFIIEGMLEDNTASNTSGLRAVMNAGVKLLPIGIDAKTRQSVYIYDDLGRYVVLVDCGRVAIPFYVSTGLGGKASVESDKWYPFFGVGADGWINKGSEQMINAYYGSEQLRTIAQTLNANFPKPRRATNVAGWQGVGREAQVSKEQYYSSVNRNLKPSTKKDPKEQWLENLNNALAKVGGTQYQLSNKNQSPELPKSSVAQQSTNTTPVSGPITVVSGNKSRTFNLGLSLNRRSFDSGYSDAQFWDATNQVSLQKQPDNTWLVVPNQSATNATVINGRVVTTPVRAHSGMTITVGRRDGSNQKTPVTIK